ncbi:MAG: DUF1015 domain-containing protein [Candidatus Omnitrophica bacterium]|nr:DUF1015 domain-containing protein [Candidatus Omnitrophota bacterium]
MKSKLKPFLALHYNPRLFKKLKDLVCPPYDIITEEEERALRKSSPYNFSHILLKEPGSSYQELGRKFKEWLKKDILVEEKEPAFYLTLQEFKFGSKTFKRIGFLGLLKLDASIFPHEKTHPAPKKDRYQVIKYTQANLSPIFVVYSKKKNEVITLLFKTLKNTPPFIKLKHRGILYQIYKISQPQKIRKIQKYFENIPLFIADGHHRFETALKFFRKNKHKLNRFRDLGYILAYFSPQDENLLVLPTHRIVNKNIGLNFLKSSLQPYFFFQEVKSFKKLQDLLDKAEIFSFGFAQGKNILYFSLKSKSLIPKYLNKPSLRSYKKLDVFLLHNWVFKAILKIALKEEDFLYTKSIEELSELITKNKNCGFLLRKPDISAVTKIAFEGKTLPQKTTYFYPKFLSGLILRKLW